jgi:hypothetical protein
MPRSWFNEVANAAFALGAMNAALQIAEAAKLKNIHVDTKVVQ